MAELVDCGFYPGGNKRAKGPDEYEGTFNMPAEKKADEDPKASAGDDKKKDSKKK